MDSPVAVTLCEIMDRNRDECIRLRPAPGQEGLVASNADSLTEADSRPGLVPLAVCHNGVTVGFVMYGLDPDDGNYWVYRIMIDGMHQGRGYGRAAMREVIDRIGKVAGCRLIMIGYRPGNAPAEKLYESLGFMKTGEVINGETVACLEW